MKDHTSPEEKLLKLIKDDKQNKPAAKPSHHETRISIKKDYFSLENLKKLLVVLAAIAVFCLIVSFIYPLIMPKDIGLPKVAPENQKEAVIQRQEPKPYDFYAKEFSGKQIFKNEQQAQAPASVADAEMLKDINLVGILSGENPQAIIEDKKEQKTYYVSKGQFIGQFQVEDIQDGKVIVVYQGNRYELHL